MRILDLCIRYVLLHGPELHIFLWNSDFQKYISSTIIEFQKYIFLGIVSNIGKFETEKRNFIYHRLVGNL